jgi:hypothetical protein
LIRQQACKYVKFCRAFAAEPIGTVAYSTFLRSLESAKNGEFTISGAKRALANSHRAAAASLR